ncbi:hypothetical protein DFH08DRAFT_814028 [Mycena albidolilacea]|uniref:Uncharacterized protein n=1 Tax=Mycena albidolilacea TaxID=1033008 RepID=A0AAD7ELX4_9AGAR|nr:hypothetical protein DFH08DRAFT_814028 [Mycena albidolilacea]
MRDVPTHAPPSQSPRPTAHQQEREPAAEHLPPEAQGRVCVNDAFVAQAAGPEDRTRIVDAIWAAPIGFSNDAVQRCLEAATGPEERRQIVACMRGRIVALPMHCNGPRPSEPEGTRLRGESLLADCVRAALAAPATPLVNKHASHMWSKITELSWTPPAPPIFAYSSWAACPREIQGERQDGIIDELLAHGAAVFSEIAKSQWGSDCIRIVRSSISSTTIVFRLPIETVLEHGSEKYRQMALGRPLTALLEFTTNEQVSKSVIQVLKEGGKETLDRLVQPAKGSELIASVLLTAKDRCAALYDCIRAHIVALCACKTGSKVIWLLYVHPIQFILNPLSSVFFSSDRMRAYYGY